jgi:hypothetical protein
MKRLAALCIPILLLSTPAISADLDDTGYEPRGKIVERERIIERRTYYEPPPIYVERDIYVEDADEYYVPRAYHYRWPHRHARRDWRPRHYHPHARYWHRHHHRHRHRW